MELNSVLFPVPRCSYSRDSRSLIWVDSTPANTLAYHVESLKKQYESTANKENIESLSSTSSTFFQSLSSCMSGGSSDASTEVFVDANRRPIPWQESPPRTPPVGRKFKPEEQSSRGNVNASPISSPPPCPQSILRRNQLQQKHRQSQEIHKSPLGRSATGQNCNVFSSPISQLLRKAASFDQHKSYEKSHPIISTPLKKAAELGPTLKNVRKTLIPCLYLQSAEPCDKLLVYFHGNAEDIGYNYDFTSDLRRYLKVNVLAVEYPGYGVYEGSPNADQILADADSVYEFARTQLHVEQRNIIIFGRSIGSGPACYLAGTRKIGGLILMCPYTSIRGVAKEMAGGLLQYFVAERFRNVDYLKHAKAMTLFIHGKKDKLIPYSHSIELMQSLKHDRSLLHLSPLMTHNEYDLMTDIISPIVMFFEQAGIIAKGNYQIKVPHKFYLNNEEENKINQYNQLEMK